MQDGPMTSREARLLYADGDFEVQRHGNHVVCAVTGRRIALDALRYWSVSRQEAYADAYAAGEAHRLAQEKGEAF